MILAPSERRVLGDGLSAEGQELLEDKPRLGWLKGKEKTKNCVGSALQSNLIIWPAQTKILRQTLFSILLCRLTLPRTHNTRIPLIGSIGTTLTVARGVSEQCGNAL